MVIGKHQKYSDMAKRVVVGISGGVDSSVAACLLKEEGYDVVGMFMINWHDTTGTLYGDCSWKDDLTFAELVARKIGISLHTIDLSKEYKQRVVDYMFSEYERGRTPNPDVLCNREIKFDLFIDAAEKIGADYIATGHYARIETINNENGVIYRLLAGIDKNKDQSYFLCQLSQEQLSKAIFPIGNITKPEVRKIAQSRGLVTAERKDSQGICFVGKVNLPEFLQQKLEAKEGKIVEIPANHEIYKYESTDYHKLAVPYKYDENMGKIVGHHRGAHFFTIGQRKGLRVGGKEKPLFVISTDVEKNIIYVGEGDDHPGLNRQALFVRKEDVHWVRPDMQLKLNTSDDYLVRIRYRQPLQMATLHMETDGLYIVFNKKQRGITPGQFAAWYKDDELIGSGIID